MMPPSASEDVYLDSSAEALADVDLRSVPKNSHGCIASELSSFENAPTQLTESTDTNSCKDLDSDLSVGVAGTSAQEMQVIKYSEPRPLLEFSSLPEYLRDNEFIHKHYRADWPLSQALWSVFGIHNETGNIWTHLVGFALFVAITVYTAMMVPSAVEIPLAAVNVQHLQQRLPPAPSLLSLRRVLASQLPASLTELKLPQLRQIHQTLSRWEMPQVKQLQRSLALVHFPDLHAFGQRLPVRLGALYKALPSAPNFNVSVQLEAMYDALPSLPRLPHLPSLEEIRLTAKRSGASLYESMPDIQRLRRDVHDAAEPYLAAVAEGLSQFPRVQEAAEPYLSAMAEGLSHLPHVQMKDVREAVSEGLSQLSHLPKGVQEAAEPYLAAMSQTLGQVPVPKLGNLNVQTVAHDVAERLSELELLHSLHHLEMIMSGMEVSRFQDALHSLVSYYACLVNSLIALPPNDTCPVDGELSARDVCHVDDAGCANTTSQPSSPPWTSPYPPQPWASNTCPAPVLYSTPTVRWPLFLFLGGAMLCLLLSAMCHLLGCISCQVSQVVWRFDYAGIAALIATSFFPPVFYGFLCQPVVRTVYLTAVLVMGTGTVAVSLLPRFQTPQYRNLRAGMFFGMGVSGIVPIAHKCLFYYNGPAALTTTLLELLMGSLYGLGALLYATRVPERWLPGKFDIAGHSHQIFHVLVIAGAYTHYRTGLLYLQWRDLHGCGIST